MRCELPQFRRCCFCLPLRYGLIGWGYFKLIIDVLIIMKASFFFIKAYSYPPEKISQVYYVQDMIISSILLFMFTLDFCLTTVYVIGGHMKNVKLLRIYYYYSLVLWVLVVLLTAVLMVFFVYVILYYASLRHWMGMCLEIAFFFAIIAVHFYILLLLRSEIVKLDNKCKFRFVNNAADAECTMTCKDDVTNGEKGIEAA